MREFRSNAHRVADWIADYLDDPEKYPVLSTVKPGELIDALPAQGPESGEPMETILADFERQIVPALTHWNHPGFMAYFATSASGPGVLGEMLAAALNANGMLWKTSPAVTELEHVTLAWLRQWIGLPDEFFGIVYDTASVASMHAIAAARELAAPEFRETGAAPGLTLYCSEQAHSSIEKSAIAIGIGRRNIRKIGVDAEFRMRAPSLEQAIDADVGAGKHPFCVVATVGTTSTTSVDPVPAIVEIARRHNLWLHIDAAYGGAAAVVPEYRHFLAGAEHADSLVVNPHKWLFTPFDLSILYTRRPDILRRAFSLTPEYLRTAEDPRAVNLMDYGVPLGRRFRALKLWFILRYYGRDGIARIIRDHIFWAQELARRIASDERFEICAPTPMSAVCFRLRGTDEENRALLDRVNATGEVFLSHTVLNGRFAIRLAIGNIGTTREHVQRAWKIVADSIKSG
ncbi:MAG: pyridoxal phosphate-dependent decarboxylase family protein [Bryobacteraceae bacterium]